MNDVEFNANVDAICPKCRRKTLRLLGGHQLTDNTYIGYSITCSACSFVASTTDLEERAKKIRILQAEIEAI
jgi:UDP-N-acetylglucosamine pyrophosphorylase